MSLAQRLARTSEARISQADRIAQLGPVAQRLHAALAEMIARSAEHPMGALIGQLAPVFTLELRRLPDDTLRAALLSMSDQLRHIATGGAGELAATPATGPQTLGSGGPTAAGPEGTPGPAAEQ